MRENLSSSTERGTGGGGRELLNSNEKEKVAWFEGEKKFI